MKARKSFLALVASAMVVNMAPVATLANETDTAVNAEPESELLNSESNVATSEESMETVDDAETTVSKLSLKFVDEHGTELTVEDSEDEPKYSKTTENGFEAADEGFFKAEYDLSAFEQDIVIDQEKLPENFSAQYDKETKKLEITFPEFNGELELEVQLLPVEVTDLPEETTTPDAADSAVDGSENNSVADADEIPSDDGVSTADATENGIVTINFLYSDSKKPVSQACVLEVRKNSTDVISGTYALPTPVGYELFQESVVGGNGVDLKVENGKIVYSVANLQGDVTIDILFVPATVNYTVHYFQQNVADDEYTLKESETLQGKTGTTIAQDLNKKDRYEGFYALNYDKTEKIAADGSTEINIYYDRNYYMLSFDLDGGYGTEPVYGRYGTPVSIPDPQKPGHEFHGWFDENNNAVEEIPATIPAQNIKYKAVWDAQVVDFTVVYWIENADDDRYTVLETQKLRSTAGATINSDAYKTGPSTLDKKHFTYDDSRAVNTVIRGDGASVVNVYYSRNVYTYTFKKNENDSRPLHSFSAKYQANIVDAWDFIGTDNVHYPEYETGKVASWTPTERTESGVENRICRQLIMEGENVTWLLTKVDRDTNGYFYYVEALPGETPDHNYSDVNYDLRYDFIQDFNRVYRNEEFFDLKGFTKKFATYSRWGRRKPYREVEYQMNFNNPDGPNNPYYSRKEVDVNFRFYYSRNKYTLTFHNFNETTHEPNIPYESSLSDKYWEPKIPAGTVEEGSMKFEGWYTSENFEEGTKFDFSTEIMPAGNVVLFARWVPVSHTVEFYVDHTLTDQHHPTQTVPHGSFIQEPVPDPTHPSGNFVGWFYKDENGNEKAFDPENSPVNRDLQLYAKYSNDTIVNYTVKYVFKDENGNEIEIAPQTNASGLVNSNKTLNAKTGTDLNVGYQEGYFPVVRSSSIVLSATEENVLTFYYVKADEVPYIVQYVDTEGNEIFPEEHKETASAVVTEYALFKSGYTVDSYSKTLVVEYDDATASTKNVIKFVYTKDNAHANYAEQHFLDDSTTPFYQKSDIGNLGDQIKPDPQSRSNYKLEYVVVKNAEGKEITTVTSADDDATDDWAAAAAHELTAEGLIFEFHYAGYFRVYLQCNKGTYTELKYMTYKNGHDLTEMIPPTHLYGGLYQDGGYTTPKTDGEHGKQIAPQVGKYYYVKTVSRNYMWPALYATYNLNDGKIRRVDAFTGIDDQNYKLVSNGSASHLDQPEDLFSTLTVHQQKHDGTVETTRYGLKDFFSKLDTGYLSAGQIAGYQDGPTGNVQYTLRPYYVTPDGIRVDSRVERTFTIPNGKFEDARYTSRTFAGQDDNTTSIYGGAAYSAPLRVQATYVMDSRLHDQPVEPETPEVPDTTVTVHKMVDGRQVDETAERGNLTNTLEVESLSGKVFAGWFEDAGYTVPADLSNVTEDITVYGLYLDQSKVNESVERLYRLGKTTNAEISMKLDEDLFDQVNVEVKFNGAVVPVSLDKQTVREGSFFDKLFGKGKLVTEYSDTLKLKKESNADSLEVQWSFVTKDGTTVALPAKTYTVTSSSIK